MKLRSFALVCCLFLALTSIPTQLLADSFCESDHSIYQYQPCGTVASANLFTANDLGISNGVVGDFQGYHADFSSDVYAIVWNGNQMVYKGDPSPLNTQLSQFETFTLVPGGIMQAGYQVELVLTVNDDNGVKTYYSQHLNQNSDGLNHVWATSMTQNQCDPNMSGPCVFTGFEDLPMQEGSDWDYNDFKMWLYGVDASPIPEPSSFILLMGAPIAFLVIKFRNLL
jgi:hypothetical protein